MLAIARHAAHSEMKFAAMMLAALFAVVLSTGPAAADEPENSLPLSRVVLFSSGVGFFEHQSQVEGDTQVELKFRVEDINDLLKSMVLQDLGGGRISTITYGSKEPLAKTLESFAIDLTQNPTLADLLNQVRGERVEIQAPNEIEGVILGVETRHQRAGDDIIEVDVLNLLTDEGLRSVSLDEVGRIKLANEQLDGELRQALAVLAGAHATDKKSVELHFAGQGRRAVRVGYVQETPIWKTSYRLVLGDDEAPFLQGWAIIENTGEMDWRDVQLTLVSGRPISFEMDLYESLYVKRPMVEPELFASLRPPKYDQDLASESERFRAFSEQAPAAPQSAVASRAQPADGQAAESRRLGRGAGGRGGGGGGFGGGGGGGRFGTNFQAVTTVEGVQRGVQSVASAAEVGELFQYAIEQPVTLARRKSAMLPIVNASVEGEKLSIYNPQVHPKHPLAGLRLTNATELHLMQGPITVFDEGSYAGDAQTADLPPGAERLISYAMDLDTEVAPEHQAHPSKLTSIRIAKGILHTAYKYRRGVKYTVKNSGSREKDVLIEQPLEAGWKLITPKEPSEKTRDRYRFAVAAKPGEAAELTVEEERTIEQQVAMNNLDDGTIQIYLSGQEVSEQVKGALGDLVERKSALEQLARNREAREAQIKAISTEQDRIRRNMQSINRNSDLYNRYVEKFSEQEDQVEGLQRQIKEISDEHEQRRVAFEEFLLSLEVE